MKKVISVLGCAFLCLTLLAGCGSKGETKTCTLEMDENGIKGTDTMVLTGKDDVVEEYTEEFEYDLSAFKDQGVELADFQKLLDEEFNFDIDGVKFKSSVDEKEWKYSGKVTIDMNKAPIKDLQEAGIMESGDADFMSMKETVKFQESNGATCK